MEYSELKTPHKTVIATWGVSNTGKSDTLVKVFDLIQQNYPNAIYNIKYPSHTGNINAVIDIINIHGISVKVGIESQGDPNSRIFTSIDEFVAINCDIILCATRTRGDTVCKVSLLTQNGYREIWITNYLLYSNWQNINQLAAQHHFELFVEVLNGNI